MAKWSDLTDEELARAHNCTKCGFPCTCEAGSPNYKGICSHCPAETKKMSCNCKQVNELVLAALGTIRQDVRSILALLGGRPEIVDPGASKEPSKEDLQAFLADWRKKADEAWDRHMAERSRATGLSDPNEVQAEDVERWQAGWAR